jgi:hypothetical protein
MGYNSKDNDKDGGNKIWSLWLINTIHIYIKRLGMFPFKVQLFQGCKGQSEPINTKSVVQHVIRYQVLLAEHYKADTKYQFNRVYNEIYE